MSELLYIAISGGVFLIMAHWHMTTQSVSLSPDGRYYLELAKFNRVPLPYCLRPFVGLWCGASLLRWQLVTLASVVAIGMLLYYYLRINGMTVQESLCGVCLASMLSGVIRTNVMFPVLTDAPAMCLMLLAIIFFQTGGELLAWIALSLGSFTNEKTPVYVAIISGNPLALIALAIPAGLVFTRAQTPRDVYYLHSPFKAAIEKHKKNFSKPMQKFYDTYLAGYGVTLLSLLTVDWKLAAGLAVGHVAALRSMDYARAVQWCFPLLILHTLMALPVYMFAPLVLIHFLLTLRGAKC